MRSSILNNGLLLSSVAMLAAEGVGSSIPSVAIASSAVDLASRASDEMIAEMELTADSAAQVKRGALLFMFKMQSTYGDDMSEFPFPDSKLNDEKFRRYWNNPDKFTTTKKKDDGETTSVEGSFYTEFANALPNGQKIKLELKAIDIAKKDQQSPDEKTEKLAKPYRTMTAPDRTSAQRRLEARFALLRNLVKRAMKLYYQIARVNDELPMVGVRYVMRTNAEGKKEVSNSTSPIVVFGKDDEGHPDDRFKVVSVGQFLAYDVDKAKLAGGTWEAFTASSNRGAKDTGDDTGTIDTIEDLEGELARVASALEDKKLYAKLLALVVKDKNGKRKIDPAFLVTLGDTITELDGLWHHIEDEYQRLKMEGVTRTSKGETEVGSQANAA